MPRYIIAGIDPGATVGIAILDLSGKRLAACSILGGGVAEAVREIERHGTPSIVSCDVFPAPEAVQKIASYFSCRLFCPPREIREEEKRKIAHGLGLQDNHSRDAYCAAILAFRACANKMRQIDSLAGLSQQEKDRLKHLLLKGYRLKDAFAVLSASGEERVAPAPEEALAGKARLAHKLSPEGLQERVSALARENANLRLLSERLEAEKAQLQERLRLLENGVRESFLRDSEMRKLRFHLQQSLGRLNSRHAWKKKGQKEKRQGDGQKHADAQKPGQLAMKQKDLQGGKERPSKTADDLNSLAGPKFDLERLVTEYRKGRSQR